MSEIGVKIKTPTNKTEERNLKEGLVEDDNEDIAYLNFRIIWPLGIISFLAVLFFAIGIYTMESLEHVSHQRYALNDIWVTYGKMYTICANYFPFDEAYYPSILRQVEIKVLTNIFFRIAVCVPMAVRIFLAMVVRNQLREDDPENPERPYIYRLLNEASAVLAIIEVLAQGMFAIVTIRFDFPELYRYSFSVFVMCSAVYMFLRTILTVSVPNSESETMDTVSVVIKAFSTLIYFWAISRFYWLHLAFIAEPPCHGYVPKGDAVIEYLVIATYLIFHLTILIDIRDIRFICYPRTCSGECEPLKPDNFKENGKFEFCRSYELRQRQVLGLEKNAVITERF